MNIKFKKIKSNPQIYNQEINNYIERLDNKPTKMNNIETNSPVFWGVAAFAFLAGTGVLVADSEGLFLLDSTFNKKRWYQQLIKTSATSKIFK